MTQFQINAIIYLILINILTLIMMGFDKRQATFIKQRIPEKTILFLCLLFGSFGVYFGVILFRHKTKKKRFVYGLPPLMLLQSVVIIYYVFQF